jgi:uncharacterized glyoxalase superfamily protein PhnB
MKLTPVLIVDSIEKGMTFWVGRMGFEKTIDVPEGDHLGFVILVRDGAELMMQTITSVQKDEPKFAPQGKGNTVGLFIEVNDFEDVKKRLDGYPITMPERKTFYGMVEIGVIEPGGNTVVFAARI